MKYIGKTGSVRILLSTVLCYIALIIFGDDVRHQIQGSNNKSNIYII